MKASEEVEKLILLVDGTPGIEVSLFFFGHKRYGDFSLNLKLYYETSLTIASLASHAFKQVNIAFRAIQCFL